MVGQMKLNPDLKEFIELLNKNEVRYLIVGGYAVAIHGHPRYTKDIDIWIDREAKNAQKVIQVLDDFGFGGLGLKDKDFLEPDQIIQREHPTFAARTNEPLFWCKYISLSALK